MWNCAQTGHDSTVPSSRLIRVQPQCVPTHWQPVHSLQWPLTHHFSRSRSTATNTTLTNHNICQSYWYDCNSSGQLIFVIKLIIIIIIARNSQSLVTNTTVSDTQNHARQEAYSVLRRDPMHPEALHISAQTRILGRNCQVYGCGELRPPSQITKREEGMFRRIKFGFLSQFRIKIWCASTHITHDRKIWTPFIIVCYFSMETRINFHMHARDNPVLSCPTCNTKNQFNFRNPEQCAGILPTDTPLH